MVNQFVNGFQTSLNPQLTKTHAAGDVENQNKLIYRSSKFSFFLLLIIGLPVLLNTKFVFSLWLKTVPDYTVLFSQLMIVGAMVEAISAPLWVIIFATGKIRTYQIVISLALLSNILFSYIAAKLGYGPEYMLYIRIFVFVICIGIRLSFVHYLISFDVWQFTKKVLFPIVVITALALPIPVFITMRLAGFLGLFTSGISILIVLLPVIYLFGMDRGEKEFINKIVKNKLQIKR
jgi:O-antigen/teichoic acid export membrane protein